MSKAFPVTGLKELDAFLTALPKNMQRNAISQALRAGAAPIRDQARLNVGGDGEMAKAIKTGSVRKNDDGTYSIRVRLDPKSPVSYIGWFREMGVAAHLIVRSGAGQGRVSVRKAARGEKLKTRPMKIGDRYVSGVINHPGHAANPFMRPALDSQAENAITAFAGKIRDYLEGKTGFVAQDDTGDY